MRLAGTQIELNNAPRILECAALGQQLRGYLDEADCAYIAGWGWDENNHSTQLSVDIYADGSYLTTVAANQFRQDLANAGIGNHAFFYPTPDNLKTGSHTINVRFSGTSADLVSSPKPMSCNLQPRPAGYLDEADCAYIAGWGWDENNHSAVLNMDIYADGNYLTTVTANQFRQDLANAGIGNHAFFYQTPANLLTASHTINVRFAGTSTNLTSSPKTMPNCSAPHIDSISPSSPTHKSGDQNVTVFGSGFQSNLTVTVFFPNNNPAPVTLSGTQIQNLSSGSFTMVITLNLLGTYGIRVNNPDGTQSNVFNFNTQ